MTLSCFCLENIIFSLIHVGGKIMKFYRVKTQQEWDWLMQQFEGDKSGKYQWNEGQKPTDFNAFGKHHDQTVVCTNDHELKFADVETVIFNCPT